MIIYTYRLISKSIKLVLLCVPLGPAALVLPSKICSLLDSHASHMALFGLDLVRFVLSCQDPHIQKRVHSIVIKVLAVASVPGHSLAGIATEAIACLQSGRYQTRAIACELLGLVNKSDSHHRIVRHPPWRVLFRCQRTASHVEFSSALFVLYLLGRYNCRKLAIGGASFKFICY